MIREHISYKKRRNVTKDKKYVTLNIITAVTGIEGHYVDTVYCTLHKNGVLVVKRGATWNGATGFPDFERDMHAVLMHDICYCLIAAGHLPKELRKAADKAFFGQLVSDGVSTARAWSMYMAVRLLGGFFI